MMPLKRAKQSPRRVELDDLQTPLTFGNVVAATDLEHHARHLAIKGEPALQHPGLTVPEASTLDLIAARAAARNTELEADTAAIVEQEAIASANHPEPPSVIHDRAIDALIGNVKAREVAVREAWALERTRSAELTAWRDEHHVGRPAEYPASRLVHFRWLLLIVVLEALAEATLLMPATPDGLIGAIGLALAVSWLTTGLGLLIGFGAVRYMAATSFRKRVAAWTALPVLIGLLLLVSFYVAHYRHAADITTNTPDDAQVIAHMLLQPMALSGPGWLLLLLSLTCAAFATWKGFTASDPIPGYEKVDRAHVDAREDRNYLRRDLQGAIAAIKSSTVKPLFDQPTLARIKRDHLIRQILELEGKRERYAAIAQQESEVARRAIAHFRNINLATRADRVSPAYFAQLPDVRVNVYALPAGIRERIEVATAAMIADAAKAAEVGIRLARLLDHTSDRTDDIMASIDRADPREGTNPVLTLRSTLEAGFDAPTLPASSPQAAIAPPSASAAQ